MPIRIMLADDHRLLIDGLSALVREAGIELTGVADDRDRLLPMILDDPPDVAVVDISMPGVNIAQILALMRERQVHTRVLVLTGNEGEFVHEMIAAGASGYMLKEHAFDELLTAIRAVADGHTYISPQVAAAFIRNRQEGVSATSRATLTARQLEILRLVAAGCTSKRIGSRLDIHIKTVDNHRLILREKLGVRSTAEMIRVAKEQGLI